ncbi:hypothetical protein BU16DRAFT_539014 [Lophium mytilinum]|uniref:Uncharacterized protein n=1 Tax=Lophium mytilinum TaxID=390894 RepID=A0A6A6QXW3_9PEZI|nr:hypothetical protein BU16DRAFT_539014 [Lophium mytilinum]
MREHLSLGSQTSLARCKVSAYSDGKTEEEKTFIKVYRMVVPTSAPVREKRSGGASNSYHLQDDRYQTLDQQTRFCYSRYSLSVSGYLLASSRSKDEVTYDQRGHHRRGGEEYQSEPDHSRRCRARPSYPSRVVVRTRAQIHFVGLRQSPQQAITVANFAFPDAGADGGRPAGSRGMAAGTPTKRADKEISGGRSAGSPAKARTRHSVPMFAGVSPPRRADDSNTVRGTTPLLSADQYASSS